jgi:UDP-glucose 6-dehydrogenase
MVETQFLTKSKFSVLIENSVIKKKMSYIDAVVDICEKQGIDPEDVRKFISAPIKDKIEAEAMKLNYLPRGTELTFE